MSVKSAFKAAVPGFVFKAVRGNLWWLTNKLADGFGQTLSKRGDFSSPIPDIADLARHRARRDQPGSLTGVRYDLEAMKQRLERLLTAYQDEFAELPAPATIQSEGYGWGYPEFDTLLLYLMLRDIKPRRYIEVGSGMSSLYATFAAQRNAAEGFPLEITCIEPYPSEKMKAMPGVNLEIAPVQDMPSEFFASLGDGDVLFIDSSHTLKIDGDVPHLYLEIIPKLAKGVFIHCHDMPFPYNTPYPSDLWVLNDQGWAMFWTEAMMLQAFLSFNRSFEIVMSAPLIRFHDEEFLRSRVKDYKGVKQMRNTFSSFWMRRVD
jgi:predicted O-methyltransferase YrrM